MATLQELNVRISADTTGLTRGVARAEASLRGLDRAASGGRGLDQVAAASKRATAALDVAAQKAKINAEQEAKWQARNIEIARRRQNAAIDAVRAQQRVNDSMAMTATTATRASVGLNSVRGAMTSVAASALSTAPGVAQLGGVIGSMALGTGMMIGVMAGMAALAFAWEKITSKAREAKKEQKEAIDQLVEAGRLRALGPLGETPGQIQAAREREKALVDERDKIARALTEMGPAPAEDAAFKDPVAETLRDRREKRLVAIREEMDALRVGIEEGGELIIETEKEIEDRRLAEQEKAAREREAAANKAMARSDMVRQAQQAAALAGLEGDAHARLKIEYAAVNKAMEARRNLTDEQLRLTLAAIEAEKKWGLARLDAARLTARVPTPQMADSRQANRTDAAAGAGSWLRAPFERMRIGTVTSRNTLGRSDTNIWQQRADQARAAGGGALNALAGGAMKLLSAFNPLALLSSTFGSALEPVANLMARLGGILATALLPILEALWPVFKLVVIASTHLGQIVFTVAGAIATAMGWLVKAIGTVVDKLLPGKQDGLIKAGESLMDLGKGFREGADALGKAREEIKGLSWEEATAPLADAAREAAYNVSEAFDANRRRHQIGAGTLARTPFTAAGVGPRIETHDTFHISLQAAPGEDPVRFGRRVMEVIRQARELGGTTEFDLAAAGVR